MCIARAARVQRNSTGARRGASIVLVVAMLVVLVGFVSLAVDIGRVRLARAELQTAADASARSGARSLPDSNSAGVINYAADAALRNGVIDTDDGTRARTNPGAQLDLEEDIEFGFWDIRDNTYTPIVDISGTGQDERRGANAVRTHARRIEARGNPVRLIFAPVLPKGTDGRDAPFSRDIERKATAYIGGGPQRPFGFIGIDAIRSNGNPAAVFNGSIASDGSINLGNGDVHGDARPGMPTGGLVPGDTVTPIVDQRPNSVVDGWMANLDFKLAPLYPPITEVPPGTPKISPGTVQGSTNPANPAKFWGTGSDIEKKTFNIRGYVRIYVTSNFDMKQVTINFQQPSTPDSRRLEYYMVNPANQVDIQGGTQQFCHVYAPQCDVIMHGTADFTGWVIGKTLTFKGNSTFNYDNSHAPDTVNKYKITLVE